jgi:outer membrane protein assembly factor BamB
MMRSQSHIVFAGIKGTVVALDRATGSELWRCRLKGSDFVNLVLDGNSLYATTKGELFCLDPATGQIRWHNRLSGLGWGLVTIATATSGQMPPSAEKRRRDQAAAAAS